MSSNLAYQDPPWEELIDGKVVLMSPRPAINHNFVSENIYSIFRSFLRGKRCTPISDGTDLYLSDSDRFVPDCMIVCDRDKIKTNGVHGAPDLVVEVLSSSTARYDRGRKKDVYEQYGVREYWIVSPNDKMVEQYFLEDGKLVLHDVYAIHPDWFLEKMSEEERAAVITEFRCSLYDDLLISLDDIFSGMIEP